MNNNTNILNIRDVYIDIFAYCSICNNIISRDYAYKADVRQSNNIIYVSYYCHNCANSKQQVESFIKGKRKVLKRV